MDVRVVSKPGKLTQMLLPFMDTSRGHLASYLQIDPATMGTFILAAGSIDILCEKTAYTVENIMTMVDMVHSIAPFMNIFVLDVLVQRMTHNDQLIQGMNQQLENVLISTNSCFLQYKMGSVIPFALSRILEENYELMTMVLCSMTFQP